MSFGVTNKKIHAFYRSLLMVANISYMSSCSLTLHTGAISNFWKVTSHWLGQTKTKAFGERNIIQILHNGRVIKWA